MRRTTSPGLFMIVLIFGLNLGAGIDFTDAARGQGAPGPETFAKPPETPMELWSAVDYLVRTGQADKAAPYLDAFLKSNPDDALLTRIHDEFGSGSVLRLGDYPATRAAAAPLLERLNAAATRTALDPARLQKSVDALTKSTPEQQYAVEQLRRAGPYAVPPITAALRRSDLTPLQRDLITQNLGRLDRTAVPALVTLLDSPDGTLGAIAAIALGQIGDTRAVPSLTYPAALGEETIPRESARRAIGRLTGQPFSAQVPGPVRYLTEQAGRYLTGKVVFPGPTVQLWTWTDAGPAPSTVTAADAAGYLGSRLANQALALDPNDREAQAVAVALLLRQSIERVGLDSFPAKDPMGAFPLALASGPAVLGDVLRLALKEGLGDVGAAAAAILGRVTDRDTVLTAQPASPLVMALSSPDRRTRFAAARALVDLEPVQNFPGASRVVPVLSRFVGSGGMPRAVVVDGGANRGNAVSTVLRELGYDASTAVDGPGGFRLASESADVEAIFINATFLQGAWKVRDLAANLRADATTKGLPIFFYGPLELETRYKLSPELMKYPRTTFVVEPTSAALFKPVLERELSRLGARPLSDAERTAFANQSAGLLARIATRPGNPFGPDLPAVAPALARALHQPGTAASAAVALGDVPARNAQRDLASVLLDPGRPSDLRLRSAADLSRSLQRFGPLVTAEQEAKLLEAFDTAGDPALRSALSEVIGALRPQPGVVGSRLRAFEPSRILAAPANP